MSAEINDKKARKSPAKKKTAAKLETAAPKAVNEPKKTRPKAAAAKTKPVAAFKVTESSKVRRWPSHEEVAALAHCYYQERGAEHGFHEQDWYRAEQELSQAS
jgi:hypothetical protein